MQTNEFIKLNRLAMRPLHKILMRVKIFVAAELDFKTMVSLFWQPFSCLHASIMASSASTAKIDSAFESLLQSVAFFSTPNDASRKIVMGQSSTQFNVSEIHVGCL